MKVIIADTETTGTEDGSEIIEAAWLFLPGTPGDFLDVKKATSFEYFHQRYKPKFDIQLGAMATHNIIPSDLEDCPASSTFELEADTGFMIGHNIDFDSRMMGDPEVKLICTLAMSRFLFPELDTHKQGAMIYYIGQVYKRLEWAREMTTRSHAALDDVRMCAILLRFLLVTAIERGVPLATWDQVYEFSQLARIPTVMGFGKHKGCPIEMVPSDYVRWYRSQTEKDPWLLEAFKRAGK